MTNSKAYPSIVLLFAFLLSCHVLTHELPEGNKHSYKDEGNNFKYPTLSQDLEKDLRRGSIDVEERIPAHNAEVHELEGSTSGSVGYHPNDFQWTVPPPPPYPLPPLAPLTNGFPPFPLVPPRPIPMPPPYPFPPYPIPVPPPPPRPNHLVDYNPTTFQWTFLSVPPKAERGPRPTPPLSLPLPPTNRDHYAHSVGYHPNGFQGTLPLVSAKAERDHYTHLRGYQSSGLEDIEPGNYEDGSVMRQSKMMRPSKIDRSSFRVFPAKTSTMTHGAKTSYGDIGEETMN